jgi:hypothetical protein
MTIGARLPMPSVPFSSASRAAINERSVGAAGVGLENLRAIKVIPTHSRENQK